MDNCIFSNLFIQSAKGNINRIACEIWTDFGSKLERAENNAFCVGIEVCSIEFCLNSYQAENWTVFQRTVNDFFETDFSEFFNLNITFDNIGWCTQFPMRLENSILINFIVA